MGKLFAQHHCPRATFEKKNHSDIISGLYSEITSEVDSKQIRDSVSFRSIRAWFIYEPTNHVTRWYFISAPVNSLWYLGLYSPISNIVLIMILSTDQSVYDLPTTV